MRERLALGRVAVTCVREGARWSAVRTEGGPTKKTTPHDNEKRDWEDRRGAGKRSERKVREPGQATEKNKRKEMLWFLNGKKESLLVEGEKSIIDENHVLHDPSLEGGREKRNTAERTSWARL